MRVYGFAFALILSLAGCGAGMNVDMVQPPRATLPEVVQQGSAQVGSPYLLICGRPNDIERVVPKLTRQQIFGIYAAAQDGELRNTSCNAAQLAAGATPVFERDLLTKDGWQILVKGMRLQNNYVVAVAFPHQAVYHPISRQRDASRGHKKKDKKK